MAPRHFGCLYAGIIVRVSPAAVFSCPLPPPIGMYVWASPADVAGEK